MIRARFLIGRILAALAAVLIVGILILNVFAFVGRDDCGEPECDLELDDVTHPSLVLLPVRVVRRRRRRCADPRHLSEGVTHDSAQQNVP